MEEYMLRQNRGAYSLFSSLYEILYQYEWNTNKDTAKQLSNIVKEIHAMLPLPSGRIGNALAVALEMQMFDGANFIMKELGIDLQCLSFEYGNSNIWDLKTTIEFSRPKKIKNVDLEKNRAMFHNFSILYQALKEYTIYTNEQNTSELKNILTTIKGELPLPSGRVGNALAVALEMQEYEAAVFMVNYARELQIDLQNVSNRWFGGDIWNANEVFELSQIGFETNKISNNHPFYQKYPWFIQYQNKNIDAFFELLFTLRYALEETPSYIK